MAISKMRLGFRIFLGITLVFSLTFFGTAVYVYIGIKQKTIKVADVAPTLFQIDIYQHYAMSALSDEDGKLKIAKSLYQKGFFDPVYAKAGREMIEQLAEGGHAPSQMTLADILLNRPGQSPEAQTLAHDYYKKSALQGYAPAQERLALLAKADTIDEGEFRP